MVVQPMASVYFVPEGLEGERVDAAASRMTGVSRTRLVEMMADGAVLLNGRPATKSDRVAAGDLVELDLPEPRVPTVVPRVVAGMRIVYDDADLVVIDKPAGVAAHPSLGWDGPDVLGHLAAAGFRISTSGAPERRGIVQRLDVGTSGLMVVAKSELAYSRLKQAFRDREVRKIYHALVRGHPDPFRGTIEAPIGRHPGHEWKMAVRRGGRHSVTHYDTLRVFRSAALIEVDLQTGRTHQIRVHMAAIKHPCVGDPLYGADPALAAHLGLDRQWLHATELGLVHPTKGEYIHFSSPYPDDLSEALAVIEAEG